MNKLAMNCRQYDTLDNIMLLYAHVCVQNTVYDCIVYLGK